MRNVAFAILTLIICLTGSATAAVTRERAIDIGRHRCAHAFFKDFKTGIWKAYLNQGTWYVDFISKPYKPLCNYRQVEILDATGIAGVCGICERTD
jgi:hypothetical protein